MSTGITPEGYTMQQKKELVVRFGEFLEMAGHLYKMGLDEVLCQYVAKYEQHNIMAEVHGGVGGGHSACKAITYNILRA